MVDFFRQLIALPFRILTWVLRYVRLFDPLVFYRIIWKVTGDGKDACVLISHICAKCGLDEMRLEVERIVTESSDALVAVAVGIAEYQAHRTPEEVDRWIIKAEEGGYKNPEMTLYLKLFLSDHFDKYDSRTVAEEILSRNDLPSPASLAALSVKADAHLEEGRWEQAGEIADRILLVQEYPKARFIKWIVHGVMGAVAESEENLRLFKSKMRGDSFNMLFGYGSLLMGRKEAAMEAFSRCDEAIISKARGAKGSLGDFLRSQEYRDHCRESA